jgi:hypothetical protein
MSASDRHLASGAIEFGASPTAEHERRARFLAAGCVLALTALGIALRLSGIGFLLPHMTEIHERVFISQVHAMQVAGGADSYGYYPNLVARVAVAWPHGEVAAAGSSLAEELERAAEPVLRLRTIVALLSVLIVPATYLLARRFFARPASLFAAALMSVNLMDVWFAGMARPHAVAAGFMVLALAGALEVRRRGDALAYVFGGLSAGLAIATLESGAAVLPALVAAHLLRRKEGSAHPYAWISAAIAIVVLCVRIFYPFLFAHGDASQATELGFEGGEFRLAGHLVFLDQFNGKGFAVVLRALWDYEPLVSLCAAAGACMAIARAVRTKLAPELRSDLPPELYRDLAVVLAFAVPYLLVIGAYGPTLDRFVLPLMPLVVLLAVYALREIGERVAASLRSPALARTAAWIPAAMLLAVDAALAAHVGAIRRAPDTPTQAARWIEAHVNRTTESIALPAGWDLPLARRRLPDKMDAAHWSANHPWLDFQALSHASDRDAIAYDIRWLPLLSDRERAAARADPDAFAEHIDATYVVLDVGEATLIPVLQRVRDAVRRRGVLAARIAPWRAGFESEKPFSYDSYRPREEGSWAWCSAQADAIGPVIEIYRLEPG